MPGLSELQHRINERIKATPPVRVIVISFVLIILVGTLLLMLPISSKVGGATPIDALFTITSATCVTGLGNVRLTDLNGCQAALMQEFIDQLAELSVRERIFSIADALIGGQPVAVSSGGGGNSDSDLRWDGRRPDEEEEAYRRRCLLHAAQVVRNSHKSTIHR